ncbi:hypothetical protein [Novosphingobium sp.]|uniref:hypothetical protein n=1 Tax=Novosphingobium sp. TaxID=1874826 RepID=UPI001DF8D936|nr:hypothetical protein [Novosphingobium sp.]MBX9663819.1 hypothetical protein [Novosphingobium sp.]
MPLHKWTMLTAGAALLAMGSMAAAQTSAESSVSPPAPPAPPEAPYVDRAEIDREVAESMAEARASMAEAQKEIAEARKEVLSEKDMPAKARAQALAALDKAERDVVHALSQARD